MKLETLHAYMRKLPGAWEDRPFGPDIPVFKVGPKMFAYTEPGKSPARVTIKLDPMQGQLLRSTYDAVQPGYHMNKEHWNTIALSLEILDEELLAWIDDSYELVVRGLTRAQRHSLGL